jgi:hypothetical protein
MRQRAHIDTQPGVGEALWTIGYIVYCEMGHFLCASLPALAAYSLTSTTCGRAGGRSTLFFYFSLGVLSHYIVDYYSLGF